MLKPKQLLDDIELVFEKKTAYHMIFNGFLNLVSIELNINCPHQKGNVLFKI